MVSDPTDPATPTPVGSRGVETTTPELQAAAAGRPTDPSPWAIVNDYTKTMVTVASALLAFTGTFAATGRSTYAPKQLLVLSWVLLVLSIAAALFSAGRLTGFLAGRRRDDAAFLLPANLSYFSFFGAVLAFLAFAYLDISQRDPNRESLQAAETARGHLTALDSTVRNPILREVIWNPVGSVWETYWQVTGEQFLVAVQPEGLKVVRVARLGKSGTP